MIGRTPSLTRCKGETFRSDKVARIVLILILSVFPAATYALGWTGVDLAGKPCAGEPQGYGPYDYTNAQHRKEKLPVVERAHFTSYVENLVQEEGEGSAVVADLDYTLRAFPNHHRALYAMMRYQLRGAGLKAKTPMECYFIRALVFKSDDYRTMLLYANYLEKRSKYNLAINIYKLALAVENTPPIINYNLGLLYVKLKEYAKAAEQAKIAYNRGIKKSKLARQLSAVNHWPIP